MSIFNVSKKPFYIIFFFLHSKSPVNWKNKDTINKNRPKKSRKKEQDLKYSCKGSNSGVSCHWEMNHTQNNVLRLCDNPIQDIIDWTLGCESILDSVSKPKMKDGGFIKKPDETMKVFELVTGTILIYCQCLFSLGI